MVKIPSFLYGPYSKVKVECRRKARELKRGATFQDLPAEQWVDTALVPGTIVLEGVSRAFPHQEAHYCCFGLVNAVDEEWRGVGWKEQCDTIFTAYHEAGMLEPWVFLGLLGQLSGSFLDQRSEWLKPFVRAAVRFWPVLAAEGARYSLGLEAVELWGLPTNLSFALARLGVPHDLLRAPLPAGGLAALVRETLPDLETV
jgi:hypothetical protein